LIFKYFVVFVPLAFFDNRHKGDPEFLWKQGCTLGASTLMLYKLIKF